MNNKDIRNYRRTRMQKELIIEKLREKGCRITKQRLMLLDIILEESEMEPFVEEVEKFAKGKNIALFGSYGWGDGEWMRDWEQRKAMQILSVVIPAAAVH